MKVHTSAEFGNYCQKWTLKPLLLVKCSVQVIIHGAVERQTTYTANTINSQL